jgi:hypothetical protein
MLYQRVADTWQLFGNSATTGPRLIAAGRAGRPAEILDAEAWADLEEKHR